MNLYEIIFEDKTTFSGGTLENTKWLEIPIDKKIKAIFYSLPLEGSLVLKNYDKYYHFVEVTVDLNGKKSGQKQLEYAYLIGKKNTIYKLYKINLKSGKIEKKILDETDKMIQQLNPIGWR